MSKEIRITKSQVECYKLRRVNGMFADITLDYEGSQGRLSISSDYGNWAYYWGACGKDFKSFLIGLNIGYVSGKLGEDKYFDLDATIKGLKSRAKDYAEYKEQLSELKDEIKQLAQASGKEEFVSIMWQSDHVMNMENHCPDLCYIISPSFESFWKNLWIPFVAELKREKEVETV